MCYLSENMKVRKSGEVRGGLLVVFKRQKSSERFYSMLYFEIIISISLIGRVVLDISQDAI